MKALFTRALAWLSRLSGNGAMENLLVLLFVILFLWAASANAEDISVEGGTQMLRGNAPYIGVNAHFDGPLNTEITCGVALAGMTEGVRGNQAAAQCLLVPSLGRCDFGLGVAYLQKTTDINGSKTNFALQFGCRFTDKLSLQWRHWSNAGTVKPNSGFDALVVQYRFGGRPR